MSNTDTYIYGLEDPLSGKIHYVGKSDDPARRLTQHLNDDKRGRTKKGRWIGTLTRRGLAPRVVILETVPRTKWAGAERRWIKKLRSGGHPLTNVAPGGVYIPRKKHRGRRK